MNEFQLDIFISTTCREHKSRLVKFANNAEARDVFIDRAVALGLATQVEEDGACYIM